MAWRDLLGPPGKSGRPLQVQLREALITAIDSGRLAPGTRLPANRRLAELLGLSRNTVIAALRGLTESGYLEARRGSGVFVARSPLPAAAMPLSDRPAEGWLHPPALRPSLLRQMPVPEDWRGYPYPFLAGRPDPALFPTAAWRESVRTASSVAGLRDWVSEVDGGDDGALLHEVRTRVLPARGIWATEQEVMITLGAQQGLFLVAQLFLSGGRRAAMEDPGSPDLRAMLRLFTPTVSLMAVDGEGAHPGRALLQSDVVFLSGSAQCPTTVALSETRRRHFLDAAARAGTLLVEDDQGTAPLAETGPLALKSMDRTGNVVHVGSLSRPLAPALRLGYVVGPAEIVAELRALRQLMLRHPPSNNQRAMAAFLSLGHYQSHMSRLRTIMAARHAACEAALDALGPDVGWRRGPGAASYWLTLPDWARSGALSEAAREAGILVEPGAPFFAVPEDGRRHLRLAVGAVPEERIAEGIGRLGALLRRQGQEAGR
ncbi:aminotransferase class I/II-fold pyridoxal phosphate-dependent enzyme [Aquicoccus sp. SCR17]|nr:aminotransferase class I/II-fold pyridoxal phosphate-dependent enzyme [Carideicomes alvinocaridis]